MYTIEQFLNSRIAVQVEPDDPAYCCFLNTLGDVGVVWKSGNLRPVQYQPSAGEYLVIDKEYGKLAWTISNLTHAKYTYVRAAEIDMVNKSPTLSDIDSVI